MLSPAFTTKIRALNPEAAAIAAVMASQFESAEVTGV